jgi:hypothetical protein
LLMVSHVDDDHIYGIIDLTKHVKLTGRCSRRRRGRNNWRSLKRK